MSKKGFFAHIHTPNVSSYSLRFSTTFGLGIILITCFVVLISTGILMTVIYEPDFQRAYESVWDISNVLPYGKFLRSLHYWGGNVLLIASVMHLLRILSAGAYAGSRYRNYIYGLTLFAGVFASLATGYFLPMDQVSYWALVVVLSFFDYLPLIGNIIKKIILGGAEIGSPMVIRLYVMHIALLPILLMAGISLHLWRLRKDQGLLKPLYLKNDELKNIPARPYAASRETTVLLSAAILLVVCALIFPVTMESQAIPLSPPNPAKAAWFFVAMQETLSYSALWGGTVPLAAIMFLFIAFPIIAGNAHGHPADRRKRIFFGISTALVVLYFFFTIIGMYFRGPNWMLINPLKIKKAQKIIQNF
ncbi:MAG TPA: hypothetical protein DHV16_04785 [Nitrospiraceae bacterium]|nr:MAG: hypothetical protein A2Z82_11720 [Nitrospirae bacterium GWA2_46_11]HAK88310.1 hypothetical protein [Nitrospiraceae bacterium]HCZ11566.1 hypothetical protein [Nitrospiraceae bacterium]